jgi:glutamine---fructose-6-phosphate transaminase (isomerizing)
MTILTPMNVRTVTDREIASQPETWATALELTDTARDLLAAPGERVLALGCGTSAFVAQAYATLREQAGLGETDWAYGSEPPVGRSYDRVVAITRSGTTTEVLDALRHVAQGTRRIGITGVTGEPVDGLVDERLLLDFADESSVVQTRFPTALLTVMRAALGYDIARSMSECRGVLEAPLPVDVTDFEHFVFLGTGWTIGLAHEAALKIREAAQAWSESYPGMDYRHGPIAVAGPRSLVTMFGAPPVDLVAAVEATGASVLSDDLDPLVQLVRAQRLAVELAASRGLDPDNPRALTRSVILASAQNGSTL